VTRATTVTNTIRSIPNPGRHGYENAQLGVSRMAIPSPPSPLLEPPLASPILPVAPPRVDDDPSEQGPNVAIIIVLLVVGSLLLLVCIECYCRRLRGTTLCEALLACIMMEPMALLTVPPNHVEAPEGFELPRWRPWRQQPGNHVLHREQRFT
jgi:hypothetical protein